MAQISKYPISKDVYERCWEVFVRTLIGIKSSDDAKQIISDLLTPVEQIMLVKRLAIAMLLAQGYEYREISKLLKVSFPTISMVKRSLEYGSNGYKKAINRILKDEQIQEFFNQTAQQLLSLPARGGMGSGMYRYLKQELDKSSKARKAF